jgi:hypothetical protein
VKWEYRNVELLASPHGYPLGALLQLDGYSGPGVTPHFRHQTFMKPMLIVTVILRICDGIKL